MTDSERIAVLEQELAQLRAAVESDRAIFQWIGGHSQAFLAATLALMQSHPNKPALAAQLERNLDQSDAQIVATAASDDRLEGFQDGHTRLKFLLSSLLKSDPV